MTVKLTPGEYQELVARAAEHSLTMSDYVVWRCLGEDSRPSALPAGR